MADACNLFWRSNQTFGTKSRQIRCLSNGPVRNPPGPNFGVAP